MCTTCGCGAGETRVEGQALHGHDGHWHVHEDGTAHSHAPHADHAHPHRHEDGTVHAHPHDHAHGHDHPHHAVDHTHEHVHADGTRHAHGHHHDDDQHHAHPSAHAHDHAHDHVHESAGTLDYGQGPARTHAPGMTQARMVRIERDILAKNDGYAAQNRQFLADRGLLALNFVSSPGSGKTTLLCKTIAALQDRCVVSVIEGDQQTANDADRIRATGAPAVQINTGKGCHLDAHMVGHALKKLDPADGGLLFIENVGNLVCPAAFDLGEACKVAILSVTEGEDKPLKYPDLFQAARLMLLNKVDLLPYLEFDVARAIDSARRVNPGIEVIQVSATSGAGMADWLAWLDARRAEVQATQTETVAALRARVAALEAQLAARG